MREREREKRKKEGRLNHFGFHEEIILINYFLTREPSLVDQCCLNSCE